MFRALGIGWGLADLSRNYSPDWYRVYQAASIPRERWAEADKLWRGFYRSERPVLPSGVRSLIANLAADYQPGLGSSGSRSRVRAQLRAFGFDRLFSVQVFSEDAPRRKPHPLPLQLAMRRLGVEPAACIYVGDAPEDVQMSRRAGVAAVGVVAHSPV